MSFAVKDSQPYASSYDWNRKLEHPFAAAAAAAGTQKQQLQQQRQRQQQQQQQLTTSLGGGNQRFVGRLSNLILSFVLRVVGFCWPRIRVLYDEEQYPFEQKTWSNLYMLASLLCLYQHRVTSVGIGTSSSSSSSSSSSASFLKRQFQQRQLLKSTAQQHLNGGVGVGVGGGGDGVGSGSVMNKFRF